MIYLVSYYIADKFQSAYIPLGDIETDLTNSINEIDSYTYLILIYLSFAFDTVNHAIINTILNDIGIYG